MECVYIYVCCVYIEKRDLVWRREMECGRGMKEEVDALRNQVNKEKGAASFKLHFRKIKRPLPIYPFESVVYFINFIPFGPIKVLLN